MSTKDNPEIHQSEEIYPIDKGEGYQMNGNEIATIEDAVENIDILSLAAATPEDVYHAQAAFLPCMDCGLIGYHTSACWVNEVATNLKAPEDLTVAEAGSLVDQVEQFDRVPWTHYGPPEEIVEDSDTSLRGMAEVIRNLDSTANDPELQGLSDQFTVLLWALKSVGEVQMLGEDREESDIEMLDA